MTTFLFEYINIFIFIFCFFILAIVLLTNLYITKNCLDSINNSNRLNIVSLIKKVNNALVLNNISFLSNLTYLKFNNKSNTFNDVYTKLFLEKMFNLFYFKMCFSNSFGEKKISTKICNKPLIYNKFYKRKNTTVLGRSYTFLTSYHLDLFKEKNLDSQSNIYNLQKRFHSGSPMQIFSKIVSPQALLEQKHLIRNKAIFLHFCEHFKNKSLTELLDDKLFITYVSNNINKEPMLLSRAFQLALEVTYFKRHFSQQTLQEVYKNYFLIQDSFNINKGICDQSTIYSSALAKKVVNYFNLSSNDIIVNSTPLFLTKEKITEPMKIVMDYNKKMTENTCPDVEIKGRPYDFKEPKDVSYGKNQIYFLDMEKLLDKGYLLLDKLEQSLINSTKNKQIKLSDETKIFTDTMIKKLQEQKYLQKPLENCVEEINIFLIKSQVPKDFKMPLFIPIKKVDIDVSDVEKMQLDAIPLEKGLLHQTKAKKAIMGVLDTYDFAVKSKIQQATHHSIQFSNTNLDDVD